MAANEREWAVYSSDYYAKDILRTCRQAIYSRSLAAIRYN